MKLIPAFSLNGYTVEIGIIITMLTKPMMPPIRKRIADRSKIARFQIGSSFTTNDHLVQIAYVLHAPTYEPRSDSHAGRAS
jgi:hypothetical protein